MSWRDDLESHRQFEAQKGLFQQNSAYGNPNLANQMSSAFQANPNMSPDEVVGLMLGGGEPDLITKLAVNKAKRQVQAGIGPDGSRIRNQPDLDEDANRNLFEFIGDSIKHTAKVASRSAFLAFDTLYNTAVGALSVPMMSPGFRQRVSAEGLGGFIGYLAEIPTGTTGWIAAAQLLSGEDVDIGSGYFVGGEVRETQERRQAEILGEVTRGDESFAWTPGRGVARALADVGVISDESWAWTVASGTVDAFAAVFLDPSNLIPGIGWGDEVIQGVRAVGTKRMNQYTDLITRAKAAEETGDISAAIQLRTRAQEKLGLNEKFMKDKDLNPVEAALRDTVMTEMGFDPTGIQQTVDQAQFFNFLTKKSGVRLVERMVEEDSAARIMDLHKHKIGVRAAKDLAEAKTTEDVVAVYMRSFTNPGEDLERLVSAVPDMGLFRKADMGIWIRNNVNGSTRWGRMLPESSILDVSKPNEYIATLRQLLDVFPIGAGIEGASRYSRVLRDEILNDAVNVLASGNRADVFDLNNRIANRFGEMFTNLGYTDEQVSALTTWRNEAGEYVRFAMKDIQDGVPLDRMPLLVTQLLTGGATVIDPAQLRTVIRNSGRWSEFWRNNSQAGKRWFEENQLLQNLKADLEDARLAGEFDQEIGLKAAIRATQENLNKMKRPDETLPLQIQKGFNLAGDFAMSQVWKPLQLVRAAFVVRVVAEETLRVLASGGFGGKGSIVEYMRATRKSGSYDIDAAGRRFSVKANDADQIIADKADLLDELAVLRREFRATGGTNTTLERRINDMTAEIKELDNKIDVIQSELQASREFFMKSQLNQNPGMAYDAIVKNPKRVLQSNGTATIVDRRQDVQALQWKEAIIDRLMKMNADPVSSRIARGISDETQVVINGKKATVAKHRAANPTMSDQDFTVYWLQTNPEGRKFLNQMADAYRVKKMDFDPDNFEQVRRWVTEIEDEMLYVIGGRRNGLGQIIDFDEDLLQVISDGSFRGTRVLEVDLANRNQKFSSGLMDHMEDFRKNQNAPNFIEHIGPATYGGTADKGLEKVISYFFSAFYGTASDKLARSPTFRRVYWKQMSQLVDRMDPAAAQQVLANARKAGINKRLVDDIERRIATAGKGTTSFETIDDIAKGAALAATRDLLFDASKRGATFDQMRLIMPFGDAWKEVTQTWAKLFVNQRGANLYRGMRNARAAMNADAGPFGPGDLYGIDPLTGEYTATPDGKREGFIYTDPTSKEKRIMIPFSQQLSRFLAKSDLFGQGVEDYAGVGFGIPVQNLSMAGGVLPGIGPVADRVINDIIPQDPNFDWLRGMLFPFGAPAAPDSIGGQQGIEEITLPGWIRKLSAIIPREGFTGWVANLINDIETDPVFQSTLSQVYSQLVSTGNYGQSAQDQIRAQQDAETVARKIYAFRGLLQGVGPGSPLSQYMASTEEGDVLAALLTEQLRTYEEILVANGESPTLALPIIMDTYGPNVWLYAAPNSISEYRGVSAKDSWWDWFRNDNNAAAVEQYSEFGGFFGPDEGEFSIDAYGSMRSAGLNRPASPKERYEIAARALGFLAYNRFRDSLPPESERTNMDVVLLGQVRRNVEEYFGVDLESSASRTRRKNQINQAISIVRGADAGEPLAQQLMSQPVGESLRIYLGARERVEQMAIETLGSANWQERKSAAAMRDFMRRIGERLSLQDPSFAKMYQYVFDGEMMDDLETTDA